MVLALLALMSRASATPAGGEMPIHIVTAVVERPFLEKVLERLREFGDIQGFAVRVDRSSRDPTDLLLQMWRIDMKIIGANAADAEASELKYQISIFRNCDDAVPKSAFDDVAAGLQEALRAAQGVTSADMQ